MQVVICLLCRAELCCAVPCRAVLTCAAPCCAVQMQRSWRSMQRSTQPQQQYWQTQQRSAPVQHLVQQMKKRRNSMQLPFADALGKGQEPADPLSLTPWCTSSAVAWQRAWLQHGRTGSSLAELQQTKLFVKISKVDKESGTAYAASTRSASLVESATASIWCEHSTVRFCCGSKKAQHTTTNQSHHSPNQSHHPP